MSTVRVFPKGFLPASLRQGAGQPFTDALWVVPDFMTALRLPIQHETEGVQTSYGVVIAEA